MSDPCNNLLATLLVQTERDWGANYQRDDISSFLQSQWFRDICDWLEVSLSMTTKAIKEGWGLKQEEEYVP